MNKDRLLGTLVSKQIDRRYTAGQLESVASTFSKVPKARLNKDSAPLVFDEVKHFVENCLSKEQFRRLKKNEESRHIKAIVYRIVKTSDSTLKNEQVVLQEKLKSGFGIDNSLRYMKNQSSLNLDIWLGNPENSYSQVEFIKIPDEFDLANTKLFLGSRQIRKLFPVFQNDYILEFKNSILPNQTELEKRAEILAKLYIQEVYATQLPMLDQEEKNQREERQKNIEIQKVKAEIAEQKATEEKALLQEQFHESDIIQQVIKIEGLLEKKMNKLAFDYFQSKNYDESVKIKKSLQKVKRIVKDTPQPTEKLRFLVRYKQQKRY